MGGLVKRRLITLLAALAVACGSNGADLRITEVDLFPEGSVRLTFEDAGGDSLNLVPLSRTNLGNLTESELIFSRVLDIGGGRFQTTLPATGSNQFFQVLSFTAPDADADGLSDALESTLNISTNTFDTDADGYGDANELLNASDPLQIESIPGNLKVNFQAAQSSAREGDGVHQVIVTLSRSFTGLLRYRIAPLSTASATTDFDLSGTVAVNGTTGVIAIPILDDLVIEDVEMLVLDVEADPDHYLAGGASRHNVLIHDNDSYWSGVLRNNNSEQAFRIRLLRQGAAVQGAFVSSIDTNSAGGVQGVGTIPPGDWPLASALWTSTTFEAVSGSIPMGTSKLFGNSTLNRVLSIVAKPGPGGSNPGTNYWIKPNFILGTYTDTISPSDPGLAYLGRESTGIFMLIEDLPVLPVPESSTAASFKNQLSSNRQVKVQRTDR